MTNAERQERILEMANECHLFRGHGHYGHYVLLKEIAKLLLEEIVEHNSYLHKTPEALLSAVRQALDDTPPTLAV